MKKIQTTADPLAEARALIERDQAELAERQRAQAKVEQAERQLAQAKVEMVLADFADVTRIVEDSVTQGPPDAPLRRKKSFGHWPTEATDRVVAHLGIVRDDVTRGQAVGAELLAELGAPLSAPRRAEPPDALAQLGDRLRGTRLALEGLTRVCALADALLATALGDLDSHRRWFAAMATKTGLRQPTTEVTT